MSGRIWIDVTTILLWKRPAVGVVRVERQLAGWILDHPDEHVAFCRYDAGQRTFVAVERSEVAACLACHEQVDTSPAAASKSEAAPAIHRKRGIKRSLRRLARRVARAIGARPEQPKSAPEAGAGESRFDLCVIKAGDAYVSVGNDWYDKDLRRLEEHKSALGFKAIGICYDLIPIRFPHLTVAGIATQFPGHVAELARVCDHVMCISACTRRDLLEYLRSIGIPPPATSVIVLGNDLPKTADAAVGASHDEAHAGTSGAFARIAARPFVLFVSTIEARKNHETLYKAWVRLIESGCDVPGLVCVGMRGWGIDNLLDCIARDPRVKDRIHFLHDISDRELAYLYRRCLYTVYPSLYEGWGLPVAESLAFGKFCLCSNAGSLTEAGGALAEYLDPWDVSAWTDRIRFFTEQPREVEDRNRRAAAHFKPQSWSDTSAAILEKAQQLVQHPA
jgi:glycosyltransferase involved in cell wall biosynthesis